ncbi:hypothetical protein HOG27_01050 [bacterium]|nr:hypothetical protein [bacterium]
MLSIHDSIFFHKALVIAIITTSYSFHISVFLSNVTCIFVLSLGLISADITSNESRSSTVLTTLNSLNASTESSNSELNSSSILLYSSNFI